jgi:hypothetical protein
MTYGSHDEALKSLQGTGPEFRNGAPNHAPMVVEALAALGRDDAVPHWIEGWVEHDRPRLMKNPTTDAVLDGNWRAALGDFTRLGEWQNLFREELSQSAWRDVLDQWLPPLVPGSMAAGTHGIIRCGHASRALDNKVTPSRLEELAEALAYCAARYRTIGGAPDLAGPLSLEEAMRELPLLDPDIDRCGPPPKIVRRLNERPDFARAVNRLARPTDITSALSELAEIGARLYLHDAANHPLVLLHAVTGPAAVQLLIKHALPELGSTAFAYMWQAVAAWTAAFSSGLASEQIQASTTPWNEIIDLSVESGDDHAVKFTEACRRIDQLRPSPVFRAAAGDWVHRVVESRDWSADELVDAGIKTRLVDASTKRTSPFEPSNEDAGRSAQTSFSTTQRS